MGFQERLLRTQETIQLSYELQHRVNAAVSFPTLSSNGSNVLIYSHESGIRIIWRGGRKFAPPKSPSNGNNKTAAPTSANDAVMIDSSDDEPDPPKQPVYEVTFEENYAHSYITEPFPDILTFIDIHFGTEATALAVCEKVEGKIVIAAACADSTVRLVALPLTPPGPEQTAAAKDKKAGKWNETIHILSGFSTPPDLVAITYQKSTATNSFPTLLIASHSREVSGLLLLHTVPADAKDGKPTYFSAAGGHSSSSTATAQYLPSPASSLDFNHNNPTLLLGFKSGCIRLYSTATSSWLLTLHTPFASASPPAHSSSSHSARKAALDAKYVLNGKAIAVLLSDGEWGIWDISGTGPSSSSRSILSQGGIKGGAHTPFSIGEYIDGPPAKTSHASSTIFSQSKFAPMTPATRKTVDIQAGLKAGGHPGCVTRGRIDVLPLQRGETTAPHDDQVAFWIEDSFVVIHSLRGHWEAKTKKGGGLFGGGMNAQSRMERVEGVNLRGEKCVGMTQVGGEFVEGGDEMVVVGEHRILLVRERGDVATGKGHRLGAFSRSEPEEYDEESSGGLEDLDRSLDRMEERRVASTGSKFGHSFGTSLGSGFGHSHGSGRGSGRFGDSFRGSDSRGRG